MRTSTRQRGGLAVAVLTALVLTLAAARQLDPLGEGLRGTYFTDAAWTSTPDRTSIDAPPSATRMFEVWRGTAPETFSATWSGAFIVLRNGIYTFGTSSDDGSWVYIDGQLVVDNGGRHAAQLADGRLSLARGVHTIFIKYFQAGGSLDFQLLWSAAGSPLAPMPAWVLTTRAVPFLRFLLSVGVRVAATALGWIWLALVVAIAAAALWRAATGAAWTMDLGLLIIGALLIVFVLPHEIGGDGRVRYIALAQLLEWHEVSPIPYSFVGPLVSAPLYFLGKQVGTPDWWCARFNAFMFIAGLWAIGTLLGRRVDRQTRHAFLLLLIAASMFPNHLEGYFAEVFTAMSVAVGLLAVRCGYAAAGWTAAILGTINTPAALGGLAAAAALQTWDSRQLRHLAPVPIAALGVMLESWLRRGSPFLTGYEGNHGAATVLTYSGRAGFSYPLFFGLLSITLSFGKGLVYYAPGLLLPVRRALDIYRMWIAFLVGLVIVYAEWWAWWGGLFWGPRFFLFASIPAAFALCDWLARCGDGRLRELWIALLVLTLSVWVAMAGVMFDFSGLGTCRDDAWEWLCLYVPEFSPLWRPFVQWTLPGARQFIVAVFCGLVYLRFATPVVRAIAVKSRLAVAALARSQAERGPWRP